MTLPHRTCAAIQSNWTHEPAQRNKAQQNTAYHKLKSENLFRHSAAYRGMLQHTTAKHTAVEHNAAQGNIRTSKRIHLGEENVDGGCARLSFRSQKRFHKLRVSLCSHGNNAQPKHSK